MTFSRVISAGVLAVAVGQGTPPAKPPAQASTALVAGQVVDATTNRPVADVVVTLSSGAGGGPPGAASQQKVLTDGSGRFVLFNLPAGRYSVTAVRAGYVAGAVGKLAVRGGGAPLQLANGERVSDARILVWKHAAIRGRVTDEAGEAVVDARVTVRRRTMIAGRPGYIDAAYATTDDRGEYRIGGLEPAAYVVGVFATSTTLPLATVEAYDAASGQARTDLQRALFAAAPTMTGLGTTANAVVDDYIFQVDGRLVAPPEVSREGGMRIYPTSFHGGTSAVSDAQVVVVTAGEQRAGIDIPLRLTRVYRLTGTIAAADGPGRPTPLLLWPVSQQDAQPSQAVASTVSNPGGGFTFLAVPPGQYLLRAMSEQPQSGSAGSNSMLWGEAPVVIVDRDVTMTLTVQTGFSVAGRIVVEGEGALPLNRIFLNMESIDRTRFFGEFSETPMASDGTFRSAPAPGGRYRLTLPVPSGWFVKSIASSGRTLEDLPIELKEAVTDLVVTVSNRGAQLSGTVRNSTGTVDTTATVILFPADPRQWVDFSAYSRGMKDVRPARDGAYVVADLPEGEYLVTALPQQQVDWSQPRFFEVLSRLATRVTLGSGEGRRLDLVTGSVKW